MSPARRPRGGSRFASFLVLVGTLSILGVTFGSGVIVGRYLKDKATRDAPEPTRHSERGSSRAPAPARVEHDPAASDETPALSFYRELTAPIVHEAATPATSKASRAEATSATATSTEAFTVQVAAYASRAQADALRERLGARGLDAEVTEVTTAAGTRYRVRIGSYPTRAEASAAAARIATDTRLGAIVARR